ncbi:hypothetical protein L916_00926 [Phytophthora nicotianae]|uniref:Uncharacterized protein n=1 Tax=Phytophthora nicotianae TaxID=4792 RepID=W2JTF7_PHYNI|nr:hypothetical protein L916_00926 [Phytophthora nicotianae]
MPNGSILKTKMLFRLNSFRLRPARASTDREAEHNRDLRKQRQVTIVNLSETARGRATSDVTDNFRNLHRQTSDNNSGATWAIYARPR